MRSDNFPAPEWSVDGLRPGGADLDAAATAYLAAADRLLSSLVPGIRGTWPRACAWLIRLALEQALTAFWQSHCPAVAACRSNRAQLLLLGQYAEPALASRATLIWHSLSAAAHHHSYELAPTASELRRAGTEVARILAALRETADDRGSGPGGAAEG